MLTDLKRVLRRVEEGSVFRLAGVHTAVAFVGFPKPVFVNKLIKRPRLEVTFETFANLFMSQGVALNSSIDCSCWFSDFSALSY